MADKFTLTPKRLPRHEREALLGNLKSMSWLSTAYRGYRDLVESIINGELSGPEAIKQRALYLESLVHGCEVLEVPALLAGRGGEHG